MKSIALIVVGGLVLLAGIVVWTNPALIGADPPAVPQVVATRDGPASAATHVADAGNPRQAGPEVDVDAPWRDEIAGEDDGPRRVAHARSERGKQPYRPAPVHLEVTEPAPPPTDPLTSLEAMDLLRTYAREHDVTVESLETEARPSGEVFTFVGHAPATGLGRLLAGLEQDAHRLRLLGVAVDAGADRGRVDFTVTLTHAGPAGVLMDAPSEDEESEARDGTADAGGRDG